MTNTEYSITAWVWGGGCNSTASVVVGTAVFGCVTTLPCLGILSLSPSLDYNKLCFMYLLLFVFNDGD